MALKVDNIQSSNGVSHFSNGYPQRPGTVIEYLTSACDGSNLEGIRGKFPTINVPALGQQGYSTEYFPIYGSLIQYLPPSNATRVVYKFQFARYSVTTHDITHYRFYVGESEVVYARHSRSAQYPEERSTFEWTINIGGTDNDNTGRRSLWKDPLNLSLRWRAYGASNYQNLHGTRYFDGTGSNQFSMPVLTLIAIA